MLEWMWPKATVISRADVVGYGMLCPVFVDAQVCSDAGCSYRLISCVCCRVVLSVYLVSFLSQTQAIPCTLQSQAEWPTTVVVGEC